MENCVDGRAEGQSGCDYFIAGSDTHRVEDEVQTSTATAYSGGIRRLLIGGEFLLEAAHALAQADPAATNALGHGGCFRLAEERFAEDDAVVARTHWNTAGDRR